MNGCATSRKARDPIRDAAVQARRDELLTVAEFATIVRIHPLSVYRRIREGRQLGVLRIGREIRIDVVVALPPSDRNV